MVKYDKKEEDTLHCANENLNNEMHDLHSSLYTTQTHKTKKEKPTFSGKTVSGPLLPIGSIPL